MINDWVIEAALELEGMRVGATIIAEVIAKHSPFKDGVAYMPVPRCETCAWWGGFKDTEGRDQCKEPSISPHQMDELMTLPDFGCVLWKAK